MTGDTLQHHIAMFVRAFGLLQPEQTPCGRPIGVSVAHTLMELAGSAGLSQAELATRLRLQKSTVSRLVTGMEQRGWVARKRDPNDRRTVRLVLTGTGRRAWNQLAAARATKYARLAARLPSSEYAAVQRALEALVRALDAEESHDHETTNRGGRARAAGHRVHGQSGRHADAGAAVPGDRHPDAGPIRGPAALGDPRSDRSGDPGVPRGHPHAGDAGPADGGDRLSRG
ncbi:MAG: MarR family transcriptional regulator [Chloroflexi bacterium]|nr:MarR family transcriptional regulator [Chloroflexota bacterium]